MDVGFFCCSKGLKEIERTKLNFSYQGQKRIGMEEKANGRDSINHL